MKDFLVLIREPDGRKTKPTEEFQKEHQQHWKAWFEKYGKLGKVAGGKPLTLNGAVISRTGDHVEEHPYYIGEEVVGGYLLLKADDMNDAIFMMKECPVYEADGFVEIREVMN